MSIKGKGKAAHKKIVMQLDGKKSGNKRARRAKQRAKSAGKY